MKKLMLPFMALAAIGFVLSLIVHVLSLLNISPPFGSTAFELHVGVFIAGLPTLFISQQRTKGVKRADVWKAALQGCPPWMRYITTVCGYYAVINFALFMLSHPPDDNPVSPLAFRGFSGHWMFFYSMAFATLYSWLHSSDTEVKR